MESLFEHGSEFLPCKEVMDEMREAQRAPLKYFKFRAGEKQGENAGVPGCG